MIRRHFAPDAGVANRLLFPTGEATKNLNLLLSLPVRPHPDPGPFFFPGPTRPGDFYLPISDIRYQMAGEASLKPETRLPQAHS